MSRSVLFLSLLFTWLLAACDDAGRSSHGRTSNQRAFATETVPLPSPAVQLADYERALTAHPSLLPERDADGRPAFYYGRVFVRARSEMRVLDLFGFQHDMRPFFDEWDWTRETKVDTSQYPNGRWEYAIATGVQWNILIETPGLVSAIELNPRFDKFEGQKQAHPMLDSMVADSKLGSLHVAQLAEAGFRMKLPFTLEPSCSEQGQKPQWLGPIGDFVDGALEAAGDAFDAVADEIADKLRAVGKDIADVLKKGYAGLQEAIDVLRELGNAGVCLLMGERSHSGHVSFDLGPYTLGSGSKLPSSVPLQNIKVQARGGPGGVLLTRTDSNANGYYHFDDFCGDIDYTVYVLMDAGAADITDDGYSEYKVDLGDITENQPSKDWTVTDWAAAWVVGAQLGRAYVQKEMGFTPSRPFIVIGWFADTITPGVSATLCGQASILTPIITGLTSGVGAFAAPLLDGDIYGNSSAKNKNLLGVAVHEYAHHAMCRAIAQLGGDLGKFLNKYMVSVLPGVGETDDDERMFSPVRNSAESFADFVAYETMGYTDYFQSAPNSNLCPTSGGGFACLEPDANWQRPPSDPTKARGWIASRASVLTDWVDTNNGSFLDDDLLTVGHELIAKAVAKSGSEPTTEKMANWVAGRDAAYPETMCTILESHGWSCNSISANGAQLDAADAFTGVALSESKILWTWAPTSQLAKSYTVVNAVGDAYTDIGSVGPTEFSFEQSVTGGANTLVVGAVEARSPGAKAGRSERKNVCTLASAPVLSTSPVIDGVQLSWNGGAASKYTVMRASDKNGKPGSFSPIATTTSKSHFDDSAAPAVKYYYRVDALNCNDVASPSAQVVATLPFDDTAYVYVSAAATGGNGSRAAPFSSLNQALGVLSSARSRVLVAEGTYAERMNLPKLPEVLVFGGYDAAFTERDIDAHETVVTGDDSSWLYSTGGGEFSKAGAPVFSLPGGSLTLEGLTVDPGLRTCSAGGCTRLTLAITKALSLRDFVYRDAPGKAPSVGAGASLYPSLFGDECVITDSLIDASSTSGASLNGDAQRAVIGCGTLAMAGSRVVGAASRTAVAIGEGTVDRSIVMSGSSELDPSGSTALSASSCVDVDNSVLAGATSLRQGQVAVNGNCAAKGVTNSALYGSVDMHRLRLVNNVVVLEAGRKMRVGFGGPLQICVPPSCTGTPPPQLTGYVIRNNVVVAEPGTVLESKYLEFYNLPSLAVTKLNDAKTYLGDAANTLKENQILSTTDGLFDSGALAANAAEPFAPNQSALVATRFAGTDVSALGVLLDRDLRGLVRTPGNLSVGPYQH